MNTCVLLLAMAAACAAMPRPDGPPQPQVPGPMVFAGPDAPRPPGKGAATDLKAEEALYLASPYSAYALPYSAYNYNARPIPTLGLGYTSYGGYGSLGYSQGYQYGAPAYF